MSCMQNHWKCTPDASQVRLQVTTPGNPVAASFLYSEGLRLQSLAATQRPDLDVQVRCRPLTRQPDQCNALSETFASNVA
jgi:hypothetical protein